MTYLLIVVLFAIIVPAAAFGTPAAQQGGNFNVSVAGSGSDSVPHQIDLKVTQIPGGQLSEVSGFVVGPEDVVQVKQGENLIVSTSANLKTHQVTVINIQGHQIDLAPLPNNVWSLQGLTPGVYTLDIIVDMSSSTILGTYETILVVLEPNQQPLPPTTIINQIIIPPTKSPQCPTNSTLVNGTCVRPSPPPGPGPGTNDTEPIICTMEISYGQGPCDEYYIPPGEDGQCPEGHRFVDERIGCVPENEFGPPPTVPCVPGGDCPPCPEGEEGSHCMDQDEQQDTDDGLPEYVPPTNEEEEEQPEENPGGDEFFNGESESEQEEQEDSEPQFGE